MIERGADPGAGHPDLMGLASLQTLESWLPNALDPAPLPDALDPTLLPKPGTAPVREEELGGAGGSCGACG